MSASDGDAGRAWWITDVPAELHAVDQAAYDAVASTPTPTLDWLMVSLSRTADHGVIDDLDSLREVASTILEIEVSLRDHRQNLITKQVSSWAAIIAVPTLVTGYYGMNVPYAGSGEVVGVVMSTGVMIVACIALYHLFRRNQWL
jgi:hypothetical protein